MDIVSSTNSFGTVFEPSPMMRDIIIIGAGPIGLACAIKAKQEGLDALILERNMLVNSIFHFPTNMTFFSTSRLLEIGDVPFISHSDKPTRREALEYFRRVFDTYQLQAHFYEEVQSVTPFEGQFVVMTAKAVYTTKKVILSTGFFDLPVMMNVPGEDLPKVHHYYDEPHPYVGQRVAVIGAANSACDVALELWQKGAKVTMIVRGSEINSRVKYWIKPNIENRIKEGSIPCYFNSHVTSITPTHIEIETREGHLKLENDFVLAMTGYQPDIPFLKNAGIEWNDKPETEPIYNPDTHESSVPGLYLAGVVCGGMCTNKFFIENAKDHADKIIGHILKNINREND